MKYTQQKDSGYNICANRERKIMSFLRSVKKTHPEAYVCHFVVYIKEGFDVKTLFPRVKRSLSNIGYNKEDYTYMYKCESKKGFNNGRIVYV